jgi:type III secretion protein R
MTTSFTALMASMVAIGLIPFVMVMLTSFVKMAVVLSIVRSALGTPQIPPNSVVTGLSLVLTLVVMAPVAGEMGKRVERQWPRLQHGSVGVLLDAANDIGEPLQDFLKQLAHPEQIERFAKESGESDSAAKPGWRTLIPAFVVSQLEDAFRMGFVVFLPFLVLDMLVGAILLSLGMHMLSPVTVSLPFKLLLFVFADGWGLLGANLLSGYHV